MPQLTDLVTLLTTMTERGAEVVLSELSRAADLEQRLSAWIATENWSDSFTYLAENAEHLITSETEAHLSQISQPAAQQRAAIIGLLLRGVPFESMAGVVVDAVDAATQTNIFIDQGDLGAVAQVLASNSNPQTWGADLHLATALLLAGRQQDDQANQVLRAVAAQTGPTELDAFVVHLRRFLKATQGQDDTQHLRAWAVQVMEWITDATDPSRPPSQNA